MAYTKIPPNGTGDAAGIGVLVASILSLILAAVAIILRVWVRRLKRKPLAFNDWLLFVAWFFSLALTINIVIFVGWSGLGQQEKNVSPDSIVLKFQLLPAAESLWAMANTATKVSILLVYKDVFAVMNFRVISDTVMGIVVMLGIGNIIQCLAICRPFAFQWDKTIPGGVCGDQNLGILLVAFLNLFTDLAIVIMPMPMVWNLKMHRTKKLALMGMFGLGIIICFITVLRIIFTFVLIRNENNSTYWISIDAIFLTLEPNLGIVNACLLLLKPLLQRMRQNPTSILPMPKKRAGKLIPSRYGLKHTDASSGNFTKLDESQDVLASISLDSVMDRKSDQLIRQGTGNFAHQETEVTGGKQDQISNAAGRGITVTRTLDMESYNREP